MTPAMLRSINSGLNESTHKSKTYETKMKPDQANVLSTEYAEVKQAELGTKP